jgi:hypothetical protein
MPLIAIFLPNAVTIRDIVHTGTLQELLGIPDARIDIYTQNPTLPEFDALKASGRVTLLPMAEYRPNRVEKFVRHIYPLLYYDIFIRVQKAMKNKPARRAIARLLTAARRLFGTRRTVAFVGRLLLWLSRNSIEPAIQGTPDLVIGTRSLVSSLEFPMVCEAVRKGLPLITAVSSWDNFTTKGYLPFPVKRTVVWNRKMAEELEGIFETDADEIVVAGYPRLPLLQDAGDFQSAEQYLAELGLGQYRRFILYSASYSELSRVSPSEPPREFMLIRKVSEQLAPTLPEDTCILIRLHPYSQPNEEDYFAGIERVHLFVPGRTDRYVERVMNVADEQHLAAQLQLSVCIVSMASTMTIDALSLGRPIINVRFEPVETGPEMICKFYDYNHFRDLLNIAKPPLAYTTEDVIAFVHRCLAGDADAAYDAAAFTEYYVPRFSGEYPRILRQTVEEVLASGRAASVPAQ